MKRYRVYHFPSWPNLLAAKVRGFRRTEYVYAITDESPVYFVWQREKRGYR